MIQTNYDKTVDVLRLAENDESGEVDTEEYQTFLEDVACHIQPLDESYGEDIAGSFGKDWIMFCDKADILEGDRIVEGDTVYKVVGIEKFNFLGEDRHMEVRIRKFLA